MRNMAMVAAAGLSLAGCAFEQPKETAEAAVVAFHQMMDAGRYHEIYAGASDDLRGMATEAEFIRTLRQLHDRLGSVGQTTESDWRIDFSGGSDTVQLQYDTQFASGRGQEEFVYRVSGGAAHLAGYHVRSPALRTGASASEGNSAAPSEGPAPAAPVAAVPAEPPKPSEPQPSGGK